MGVRRQILPPRQPRGSSLAVQPLLYPEPHWYQKWYSFIVETFAEEAPYPCGTKNNKEDRSLQVPKEVAKSLVAKILIPKFRYLLIQWIVCMHISFSCVEAKHFRQLILHICSSFKLYLVESGNTIRA